MQLLCLWAKRLSHLHKNAVVELVDSQQMKAKPTQAPPSTVQPMITDCCYFRCLSINLILVLTVQSPALFLSQLFVWKKKVVNPSLNKKKAINKRKFIDKIDCMINSVIIVTGLGGVLSAGSIILRGMFPLAILQSAVGVHCCPNAASACGIYYLWSALEDVATQRCNARTIFNNLMKFRSVYI